MKIRNSVYILILANMPTSIGLTLVVFAANREMAVEMILSILLGHYLFMGIVGSIVGVVVLSRLQKLEGLAGQSMTITGLARTVTNQIVDDYNRLRRIQDKNLSTPKTSLDDETYER